jgi:hypothetical protein
MPLGIGKGNAWHRNGIINAQYPPYIRGTLYDVEELNNLFASFSARIGFDISRLVIEGKRQDGKRYASCLLANLYKSGVPMPGGRELYGMIGRFARAWGLGKHKMIEYRPGDSVTVEVEDVYNIAMFRGDLAGASEAIEGKRMDPQWEGDKDRAVLTLVAVPGEPEFEQVLECEVERGVPYLEEGDLEYRLCLECGAPLEISEQFDWDAERARITERATGRRFVLHNTNGIVAVVRVLRKELGEEVEGLLVDISREYSRGYYDLLVGHSSLDAELAKFPLRSWGRPVGLELREQGCSLKVINPYCPPVVVGRVWGLMESFLGREMRLTWAGNDSGIVTISLEASQNAIRAARS